VELLSTVKKRLSSNRLWKQYKENDPILYLFDGASQFCITWGKVSKHLWCGMRAVGQAINLHIAQKHL